MRISFKYRFCLAAISAVAMAAVIGFQWFFDSPQSDDPDYMAVLRVVWFLKGDGECRQRGEIGHSLPSWVASCETCEPGISACFVSNANGCELRKSTAPTIRELRVAYLGDQKVIAGTKTGYVFEVRDGVITDFFRLPNDEMGRIENAIEEWESGLSYSKTKSGLIEDENGVGN